jgi:DNA-binding MarR family transcriptional regulator
MNILELSQLSTYDVGLMQAQAYRALNNYMTESLRQFELTMIEWAALGRICDSNGLRVSDIAAQLSVEIPRVIVLIKSLERKGYVTRKGGSGDKRVIVITATSAGLAKKDQVEQSVKDNMRYFMLGVKRKDLVAYIKILQFLSAKLYK